MRPTREASRQVNDSLYFRFNLNFFAIPLKISIIEVVMPRNVSMTSAMTIASDIATRGTAGTIKVGANNIMRYGESDEWSFIPSALALADPSTTGADAATFASRRAVQITITIVYIVFKRDLGWLLSILARWFLCPGAARVKSFTLQTMQGWFQLYTNGPYVTNEEILFNVYKWK